MQGHSSSSLLSMSLVGFLLLHLLAILFTGAFLWLLLLLGGCNLVFIAFFVLATAVALSLADRFASFAVSLSSRTSLYGEDVSRQAASAFLLRVRGLLAFGFGDIVSNCV